MAVLVSVGDNVYRVTVTATDPSLAATPVHVAITVTDLNEAPAFAVTTNPKAWTINEDDGGETAETAFHRCGRCCSYG